VSDDNDATIRKMLRKHKLVRIQLSSSLQRTSAVAYPEAYHPIVEERRRTEMERAAEQSGGSLSIQEASRITNDALRSLASGYGATIEQALADLDRMLSKAAKRAPSITKENG
jgi:hypothetical protein